MSKTIKIEDELVERIDKQTEKYSLRTRQNLTNTLVRKSLEFMETAGYEALLKLSADRTRNGKAGQTRA